MKNLIFILCVVMPASQVYAGEAGHIYSTGTFMEVDRCASAWLIKRYVDKEAVFQFFPDSDLIKTGIPFDTPYSALCRTHNKSTFEVIMDKENISDKDLKKIAKIIHDYEINFWGNKDNLSSSRIVDDLKQIIKFYPDNNECFLHSFQYLDTIMKNFAAQGEN